MALVLLGLLFANVKLSGADVFMSPLGRDEILMLWTTRTRKIKPVKCVEAEEGYIDPPFWGLVKATSDSSYSFLGKPCVIGGEGIMYTFRLEHAKMAEVLEAQGIHTKEELKKALGIVVEKKPKGEKEKPKGGEVEEN